jgi:acylphosphatase
MADTHHETVHYAGHVQGVGFRYTARQVAKEFEVTGYVKNLLDGRVLVEVEGTATEVGAYLAALEERMHGHIRKVERKGEIRPPQFNGFSIR